MAQKEARPRYQRKPRNVQSRTTGSLAHFATIFIAAAAVVALAGGVLYSLSIFVFVGRYGVVPWIS